MSNVYSMPSNANEGLGLSRKRFLYARTFLESSGNLWHTIVFIVIRSAGAKPNLCIVWLLDLLKDSELQQQFVLSSFEHFSFQEKPQWTNKAFAMKLLTLGLVAQMLLTPFLLSTLKWTELFTGQLCTSILSSLVTRALLVVTRSY